MIERTVTVKSIDWPDTKDGKKQYLKAVLVNDEGKENTQAIFDPDIQGTIQTAYEDDTQVDITLEKKGNFWNITSATPANGEPKPKPKAEPKTTNGHTSKDDEILLAVAFKGAVELECHLVPGAEPNTARVIQTTSELLAGLMLMRPKRVE